MGLVCRVLLFAHLQKPKNVRPNQTRSMSEMVSGGLRRGETTRSLLLGISDEFHVPGVRG